MRNRDWKIGTKIEVTVIDDLWGRIDAELAHSLFGEHVVGRVMGYTADNVLVYLVGDSTHPYEIRTTSLRRLLEEVRNG
jgi:hypothetical protein